MKSMNNELQKSTSPNLRKPSKPKKQSPKQKKIAEVMHEFKEGDLHSGKTETIVTNPKQAIAIALSEAEGLDKNVKKSK